MGVTQVYLLHVGGKAGNLSLNLDNPWFLWSTDRVGIMLKSKKHLLAHGDLPDIELETQA